MNQYARAPRGAYARSLRRPLSARLVAVLDYAIKDRGYTLIGTASRVVRAGDVHELIVTAEATAAPGAVVNDIAVIGFAEFAQAGVLVAGDEVMMDTQRLGTIAGFEESHAPNHINIVIAGSRCQSGREAGARLEGQVVFVPMGSDTAS